VQGTHKSEATIEVGFDPRLEVSVAAEKAKEVALAQIDQWMDTAAQAVRQMVQSQQTAKELAADMKKEDAKGLEDKIKQSEKISESLEELIALYLGKQDKRQGITRSPEMTVVQRLGTASSYISSRPNGVTATETQLMELAKKSLQDALKAQNEFFETTWKEFQKQVENWEQTRFKPTKTFNLVP
jgi:DNA mismatch repair ATPase MutL